MNAHARTATGTGRRATEPEPTALRLNDLPSIAAHRPGVERVTLDDLDREPTLDDALRDPDLFAVYVGPYVENADEVRP